MSLVVQKYGGSSLTDAESIKRVARRIVETRKAGNEVCVVVSAMGDTTDELMDLAKRCQTALREIYRPQGFNLGMNLGRVAGAGIPDHIHMHIIPRWPGDTNFMTSVAEVRVLSEDLPTTYRKLREKF